MYHPPPAVPTAGGATIIASEYVAGAPADGYMILSASSSSLTIAPQVYKNLKFAVSDFQPIAGMGVTPYVIAVSTALPVTTVKEFIAYAKERPDELNYYQLSPGTMPHLFSEVFFESTGIKATPISYKGETPALNALLANEIQFMPVTLSAGLLEQHNAGKIRIVGVADTERSPAIPDVPTFEEAGLAGVIATAWFGILGPKGLSDDVVEALEQAMGGALKDEQLRARLLATGTTPRASTAQELESIMSEQYALWGSIIQRLGITLEQ